MDFFFHDSEISAVRHVYVTQSSLKRPIHVTRDMAVAQEFRCGLSKFHCRNEVKEGHKVQKNCRPQYILERIGICVDFENLCSFVIRTTHMFTLAKRVQILHLKARVIVLYG